MDTTNGMFEVLCEHIEKATNHGVLKPTITVFRQRSPGQHDLRVWNWNSLAYAGYQRFKITEDGKVEEKLIGDQGNLQFTQVRDSLILGSIIPYHKKTSNPSVL